MAQQQPARRVSPAPYGRGTGVSHPVDVEVGARIRQRRLLLGMNQETLARRLGLTFQQVQKYEMGANRVSASRLSDVADVLGVPIAYFFGGISADEAVLTVEERQTREVMRQPETIDLVRFYYAIRDDHIRRQFLALVKAIAAKHRAPAKAAP
jgi:transcriptional regulator with XRE-family HTH domain